MARKSRTGENIYFRKDGRWEGRRRIRTENGKTVFAYIYAESYEEAVKKLSEITNDQKSTCLQKNGNSFRRIANEWLELQKPQLKPASLSTYANILNTYLLPEFGDRNISEISRAEFTNLVCNLLERGGPMQKGLSASTVSIILTVAKNIFHYASRERELSVADICGIPIKQEKNEPATLSREEQTSLVNWLYDHLTPCNLGILLGLYTGMRIGEICALKWRNISKDDQSITVCQNMQRIHRLGEKRTEVVVQIPKSASSIRTIPVTDEIARLLSDNRKEDDAYLLTGEADRFIEPRNLQRQFKKALEKSGLKDINFHALRHTFATRGIEIGFDPKTLSSVLGHATVNMTLNRYVHPTMEQKQRNMNLFSELLAVN